jgi:hypothetical protein
MALSMKERIALQTLAAGVQSGAMKDLPMLAEAVLRLNDAVVELRRLFERAERLAGRHSAD